MWKLFSPEVSLEIDPRLSHLSNAPSCSRVWLKSSTRKYSSWKKKKFDVKILSLSFFRPRASSSRKILRKRLPLSSPLLRYFALMQFLEWPQARSPLNFHQHSQSGPPRRENRCRGSQWLGSLVREGSSFLPSSFFLLLFSPFYSMYTPHLSSIVPNSSSARSVSLSPGTIAGRGGVEALTVAWISRLTNKRERGGERTRLMDRSRSIRLITSIDETRWTRSRSRVCSSSRY